MPASPHSGLRSGEEPASLEGFWASVPSRIMVSKDHVSTRIPLGPKFKAALWGVPEAVNLKILTNFRQPGSGL